MTVLDPVHVGLQLRYGIMVLYNVALSVSEEDSSPRSMPGSMAPWATEAVAAPRASCVLFSQMKYTYVISSALHATRPCYAFHQTLACNQLSCYNEDTRFVNIHHA